MSRSEAIDVIASAHYILIALPLEERETYSIAEAPISLKKPWVVSPEVSSFDEIQTGPHNGGYFYAGGFQNDVQYRNIANR